MARAAAEFYGPDRELFLGPLTGEAVPSYLKGEYPGDYVRPLAVCISCPSFATQGLSSQWPPCRDGTQPACRPTPRPSPGTVRSRSSTRGGPCSAPWVRPLALRPCMCTSSCTTCDSTTPVLAGAHSAALLPWLKLCAAGILTPELLSKYAGIKFGEATWFKAGAQIFKSGGLDYLGKPCAAAAALAELTADVALRRQLLPGARAEHHRHRGRAGAVLHTLAYYQSVQQLTTQRAQVVLMGLVEGYRVNGGPAGEGLDPLCAPLLVAWPHLQLLACMCVLLLLLLLLLLACLLLLLASRLSCSGC